MLWLNCHHLREHKRFLAVRDQATNTTYEGCRISSWTSGGGPDWIGFSQMELGVRSIKPEDVVEILVS